MSPEVNRPEATYIQIAHHIREQITFGTVVSAPAPITRGCNASATPLTTLMWKGNRSRGAGRLGLRRMRPREGQVRAWGAHVRPDGLEPSRR
jgi:hypothetical protein